MHTRARNILCRCSCHIYDIVDVLEDLCDILLSPVVFEWKDTLSTIQSRAWGSLVNTSLNNDVKILLSSVTWDLVVRTAGVVSAAHTVTVIEHVLRVPVILHAHQT